MASKAVGAVPEPSDICKPGAAVDARVVAPSAVEDPVPRPDVGPASPALAALSRKSEMLRGRLDFTMTRPFIWSSRRYWFRSWIVMFRSDSTEDQSSGSGW